MSTTNAQVSCGIGIERPFGRRGDRFGFGYNWSRPSDPAGSARLTGSLLGAGPIPVTYVGLAYNETNVFANTSAPPRPQSMIEAFYRIQLTESMQLSPDIQVIFKPGTRSDVDTSVVLGLRLTTDF